MNDVIRLEIPLIGDDSWADHSSEVRGRPMYYDRRGNPLTLREWGSLTEWSARNGERYKRVRQEYVGDYWISTVWLGLDHSFGSGAPLIFETMVFNKSFPEPPPLATLFDDDYERPEFTSWTDLDCERYATEEQAIAGHEAMVEKVRLIVEATDGPS